MDTQLYLHCLLICILGVNGQVLELHLTLKNTPLTLKSPGWPDYIKVDKPMLWKISAPEGSVIRVDCYDFRAEVSDCNEDTFRIETIMKNYSYSLCDTKFFSAKSERNICIKMKAKAAFHFKCKLLLSPSPINEGIPAGKTSCPCGKTKKVMVDHSYEFFWSFRVFLRDYKKEIFCSGSILTSRHILTAAHCLAGKFRDRIEVALYRPEDRGYRVNETIRVINTNIHPDYKESLNDIAILKLAKNITFDDLVGPVCLPLEQGEPYSLVDQWVTAIGVYAFDTERLKLKERYEYYCVKGRADLVGMDYESCQQVYPDVLDMTNRFHFCAISVYGDKEQCATDGPLVYLDRELNRYVQVGLTANAKGCLTGRPNIYTDVRTHITWIEKIISEGSFGLKICKKRVLLNISIF